MPFATVEAGAGAIRDQLSALKEQGRRYAIVDAIVDRHLVAVGEAVAGHALITGGSGRGDGVAGEFPGGGVAAGCGGRGAAGGAGHAAVLAGSCSRATLFQIGAVRGVVPVLELDPLATPDADALAAQALEWAGPQLGDGPW